MGLLDFDEHYTPRYRPPRANKEERLSEEQNLSELNNLGHEKVTEDFSDSPFADRK